MKVSRPTLSYTTGTPAPVVYDSRSEEHTSELQSHLNLVCRLLLEKKKKPFAKLSQYSRHSLLLLYNIQLCQKHIQRSLIQLHHLLISLLPHAERIIPNHLRLNTPP